MPGSNPPEGRLKVRVSLRMVEGPRPWLVKPHWLRQTVSRGKVTGSWRCVFFSKNIAAALIVISRRFVLCLLFFVRVNQVLVRLWARAMEAGLCLVFVPLSG